MTNRIPPPLNPVEDNELVAHRAKFTPQKRAKFLKALALGYSVTKAAKACGMSRRAMYDHRAVDLEFAKEWEDAYEAGTDLLEDKLRDFATGGDTTALIFALKSRRPGKYRERQSMEISGPGGRAIGVGVVLELPANGRDDNTEGNPE